MTLVDFGSFGDFGIWCQLFRSTTIATDKRETGDFFWRSRVILGPFDWIENAKDLENENDDADGSEQKHEFAGDIHSGV